MSALCLNRLKISNGKDKAARLCFIGGICMETSKLKPFATDGCSGGMSWFWRVILKRSLPWENTCVAHDKKYWCGGTKEMRKAADVSLMQEIERSGHPYYAILMFVLIRVFGSPWLPFPWRWGFGYKYGCGYKKIKKQKD